MCKEALEIASQTRKLISGELPVLPVRPRRVFTVGRGSSDHAALVIHHLLSSAGVVSSSMPMSLIGNTVDSPESLYLLISQSGASPDICAAAIQIRQAGCSVLSLVNQDNSRLANEASHSLSQCAGSELAVAATKSVVCSIVAGARLAEYWGVTIFNLIDLPEQIQSVQNLPSETLTELFVATGPILVIGRGSGYGIACEIALKLQELLGRAAMAYSSSEVLHGPAGMITSGYCVLALAVGPECDDVLQCVDKLAAMGAECHVRNNTQRQDELAATLILCHIYLAIEKACVQRGLSPDMPRNLSKVTLT